MKIDFSSIKTYQFFDLLEDRYHSIYNHKENEILKDKILAKYPGGIKKKYISKAIKAFFSGLLFWPTLAISIVIIISRFVSNVERLLVRIGMPSEFYSHEGFLSFLLISAAINALLFSIYFGPKDDKDKIKEDICKLKKVEAFENHVLSETVLDKGAIKHLKQIEKDGRESFSKYSESGDTFDLLSAVYCGHPYAILLAIIETMSLELSKATTYSKFSFADKTKEKQFDRLIQYCNFFDYYWKYCGIKEKPIYEKEFSDTFYSSKLLNCIFNNMDWDDDQNNIIPELKKVLEGYFKSIVRLTTSDWQRIIHNVDNQFNDSGSTSKFDGFDDRDYSIPSGEVDLSGTSWVDYD